MQPLLIFLWFLLLGTLVPTSVFTPPQQLCWGVFSNVTVQGIPVTLPESQPMRAFLRDLRKLQPPDRGGQTAKFPNSDFANGLAGYDLPQEASFSQIFLDSFCL